MFQRKERLIAIPRWMVIVPEDDERRIKLDVKLGLAAAWLSYHNEESEEDGKQKENK